MLESLLSLTLELHSLDQSGQPSDAVEHQLQRVHRELALDIQFGQSFQVTRGGQVYLVSLSPVGVRYQLQQPFDGALQATA
ncbi:hypothetical protein BOO71_0007462 [Deinococcus marmoris]|uniref:Uncharacterized protein n=1 Tax=Deinococcus marmoris TaxID=249408 RepID=A0A1U7NYA4_9DEIO|nr:hypothetical protein BOO71_0007462 [Deinococcus marmoris]